ncbi:MAG: hypothetical protein K0Q46_896 [Rhodococcus erythropolis]|nr:hypothetical protein [Rhodococcus erythropolis]
MAAMPKHLRQSSITVDRRAHEIRGSDLEVRIVDGSVQGMVQVRDTLRVLAGGEPASQDRFRGSCAGCSGMNPKRRRMGVSRRAIERSAVLERGR